MRRVNPAAPPRRPALGHASGASRLPSAAHELGGKKRFPCGLRTRAPAGLAPLVASPVGRRPARARSPRGDEGPGRPANLGACVRPASAPTAEDSGCGPRCGSGLAAGWRSGRLQRAALATVPSRRRSFACSRHTALSWDFCRNRAPAAVAHSLLSSNYRFQFTVPG